MIDFLYNNLSIPSKTLPNIEKAQSEFGRSIEKKHEKITYLREPKRTKNNSGHYCAATTTIWPATNLDPWRNELPK